MHECMHVLYTPRESVVTNKLDIFDAIIRRGRHFILAMIIIIIIITVFKGRDPVRTKIAVDNKIVEKLILSII
jgi:hypothetical protein